MNNTKQFIYHCTKCNHEHMITLAENVDPRDWIQCPQCRHTNIMKNVLHIEE
jgi:DNA-directed RNA polymerase subunit RPC12/RpoP